MTDCNTTHTEYSSFDLQNFIKLEEYNKNIESTILGINTPELYVVIKDGVPRGYLKNIKMARQYMWYLARFYKNKLYDKYITFISEGNCRNKIQIAGRDSFFSFPHDRVFSNFEIYKIKEIPITLPENNDTDTDYDIFQPDKDALSTVSGENDNENTKTNSSVSEENDDEDADDADDDEDADDDDPDEDADEETNSNISQTEEETTSTQLQTEETTSTQLQTKWYYLLPF
jgi:hypothetical protein